MKKRTHVPAFRTGLWKEIPPTSQAAFKKSIQQRKHTCLSTLTTLCSRIQIFNHFLVQSFTYAVG